jgi:phenylacetate-CoA ligase
VVEHSLERGAALGLWLLLGGLRPGVLTRIADDLVATLAEFGAPGDDSALLPGQDDALDADMRRMITTRSLRRTAQAAAQNTAYYRRLFRAADIQPRHLSVDDWGSVPLTSKKALRSMPSAFVSARANPVLLASTTGTTGTPTSVWFSAAEIEIMVALNMIGLSIAEGMRPHHVLAQATSSRSTLVQVLVTEAVRRTGVSLIQLGTIDPVLALERLAAPLGLPGKAAQPTHLTVVASYLAALIGAAEAGGWQSGDFGLESIQAGGEVLSDALRSRAGEVFGAEVTSNYAATETVPAGATACRQGHLHHPAEFGHVELLDPGTFEPARPGEIATLVVTPYVPYRDCTLVLRYVTNDLVRVLDEVPSCELAGLLASSAILGRFSGPSSLLVPTRAILELLEGERAIPLPARYSLADDPAGPVLHVVASRPSGPLMGRLEERAAYFTPKLGGIVLHEDPAGLPSQVPLQCDLVEHSFELAGRVSDPIGRPA